MTEDKKAGKEKSSAKSEPSEADLRKALEKAQASGVGIREAGMALGDYHARAVAEQEAKARAEADKTVYKGE